MNNMFCRARRGGPNPPPPADGALTQGVDAVSDCALTSVASAGMQPLRVRAPKMMCQHGTTTRQHADFSGYGGFTVC